MAELAALPLIPKLPYTFGRGKPAPARMAGATIIAIGTVGGGLAIDYTPRRSKQTMRVVLAMEESGMSIRYHRVSREVVKQKNGRREG